jgi:ribulose-5-phosphate 4-epimerase/fuculose-1-phosphate aldolase
MSQLIRYEARKAPVRRPTEQQLRQEIIQICRLLHQGGYCLGYDGNVSARLDGRAFSRHPQRRRQRLSCAPTSW